MKSKSNIIKKSNRIIIVFLLINLNLVLCTHAIHILPHTTVSHMWLDSPVYPAMPDWISENPHYSTGAALVDMNNDGWLDLIIADGNDIMPGGLNVYYNNGQGSFPRSASWQSSDQAYNGHLDVADVNGDGWLDVAVAHLGTGSAIGPIARVYLNNGGILSSVPDWSSDIIGNAFGVDFGDMNNDGRPDLAVATGWSYNPQHFYHNYVYLNIDGSLEPVASWVSNDTYHYMGVLWIDADDDGWLDLVGIGLGQETQLYRNVGGVLETRPSWQTSDSFYQDGIMLTGGDVNGDGTLDLFATDNVQLGGDGFFKQYRGLPNGLFESTASWSYFGGHGSTVALADVNGDRFLDLAVGSWWGHTHLFYNDGGGYGEEPSWSSGGTSVNEKIIFGDVGPTLEQERTIIDRFIPDGHNKMIYLSHQPIQAVLRVTIDGVDLDHSEYTYSLEHGWVSFSVPSVQYIEIEYRYSRSLDMVVSNWDSTIGNYLYYNQLLFSDLECSGIISWTDVNPGETVTGSFELANIGDEDSLLDWEILSYPGWGLWSFNPRSGTDVTPGEGSQVIQVSVTSPLDKNTIFNGSITVTNTGDSSDFCIIPVSLSTPLWNPLILFFNILWEKIPPMFPIFRYILDVLGYYMDTRDPCIII
jgi:hypothetical protein